MTKIRDIVPGPLPDGKLRKGEVVLSPVGPRRYWGKWLAVGRVMLKANRATQQGNPNLLFRSDLGWRAKIERIKANLLTESTRELYQPETMHLAGLRRAICHCTPGCGHRNGWAIGAPSDAARERKRMERRQRRKGSRR